MLGCPRVVDTFGSPPPEERLFWGYLLALALVTVVGFCLSPLLGAPA